MAGIERTSNRKISPLALVGGAALGLGTAAGLYSAYKRSQILNQMKALNAPLQMISL